MSSSDLWMRKPIPNCKSTNISSSVHYAIGGSVQGPVQLAETSFAGFTVENQAFNSNANASITPADGLIGLGPSSSSNIRVDMRDIAGDTFLDNVFRSNKMSQNFITVLLSRDGDTASVKGQFSIEEVIPDFENITQAPKLPVIKLEGQESLSQHWTTLIDGLVGPSGQNIPLRSNVADVPEGKFAAFFDTGFTFSQVPKCLSDAIYRQVPGASFNEDNNLWILPGKEEVNVSVIIGGQEYPLHPWDTSMPFKLRNGSDAFVGTLQPQMNISAPVPPTYDAILGMAFLRNVYMLINFGDFVDEGPDHKSDPFIQLLSVTEPAAAQLDFVRTRFNGTDLTGNQTRPAINITDLEGSCKLPEEKKAKGFFEKNWPVFLGTALRLTILLIVLYIWSARRLWSRQRSIIGSTLNYKRLSEAAPPPATEELAITSPAIARTSIG
ncbi:hypothetical protein M422DRAFT_170297 [Sphaerobolus stellatus SS14]|uniref:Peptidase A1 domain-containing protein n=1 Tax=Sphaerobolus stellatus (strain SS14) TaxID=990650 RepID=A0A0C9VMI8_SPHS4|nr:hypothetical protein M422DRAFT_170297 [Sphaerobolus stellatus SS14]